MRERLPTTAAVLVFCAAASAAEYTVRAGDTLSGIAEKQLGSTARWKEIADTNGLRPPYHLRPGQQLVLPERRDGSSAGGGLSEAMGSVAPGRPGTDGRTLDRLTAFFTGVGLGAAVVYLLVGAFLWWVAYGLCLRGGCWFALVETTTGRCFRLALYLALVTVACLLAALLAFRAAAATLGAVPILALLALGAGVVYFVASLAITRRVLACRWRSTITVLVMATFVAQAVVFAGVAAATTLGGVFAATV